MSNTVEYVNPPAACPAQGLYSHATLVPGAGLAFIAGQLSVGDDGSVVGENDFDAQFARVFHNLKVVIEGLDGTHADIVKFTTFLTHEDYIPAFMRLRAEYFPTIFPGDFPPNTLLIVRRLVKPEFLVEVEATITIAKA